MHLISRPQRSSPRPPAAPVLRARRPWLEARTAAGLRTTRALPRMNDGDTGDAEEERLVKLHVGCGLCIASGWLNCDLLPARGLDFCADIVGGLPLDEGSVHCIAAMHVLQDLAYPEILPALMELHRVLKPGGVLRLGLMDFDGAIAAYLRGDAPYFRIPDEDALSVGAKLVARLVAYGSIRTPCNEAFTRENLERAGFRRTYRCSFGVTPSRFADLPTLDSGEPDSFFVEALK